MSERINTPFTNEHFTAYCLKMVGHPSPPGIYQSRGKKTAKNQTGRLLPCIHLAGRSAGEF